MFTSHVLIYCKYLVSRNFLSNAVISSCDDVGISALFTLYWAKMKLIFWAQLSCPCFASVESSSYIPFIIHSLGILKMRNQYLINWSCCLSCNGNCPVSPYMARSGVLWSRRSAFLKNFSCTRSSNFIRVSWHQISLAYSIIGRICWLKILKESCIGSSLPTALYTDVLDAIMAFVVLSFKYSKCPLKRCPWFENITPRYLYLIHSSMSTSLNVGGWDAGITWNFVKKNYYFVFPRVQYKMPSVTIFRQFI